MLRECIRYEALTKILLNSENFYDFFKYVEVSTFDIASDAFATFKVWYFESYFVTFFPNLLQFNLNTNEPKTPNLVLIYELYQSHW